jgi:hypothetical protein
MGIPERHSNHRFVYGLSWIATWRLESADGPTSPVLGLLPIAVLSTPSAIACNLLGSGLLYAMPLALLFLFIFLTDIPGTPNEMLERGRQIVSDYPVRERREVHASFLADSAMAIINPFMRITPSIYYAENLILRGGQEHNVGNALPAVLCGLFYLLAGVFLGFSDFDVGQFKALSLAAVSPILFYIGIRVVANSMVAGRSDNRAGISPSTDSIVTAALAIDYFYYLPTAPAIILTPLINFQVAIPVAILVYWACYATRQENTTSTTFTQADPKRQGAATRQQPQIIAALGIASVVILLIWLATIYTQGDLPAQDVCPMSPLVSTP